LIPVKWYFTDRPYLPFPHVYGTWKDDRLDKWSQLDYDDGGPGEVTTIDQPFWLGSPPPILTCTGYKGSPAAWLGEDTGERYPVGGYPGPRLRAHSDGYSRGFS
jgi:hypothetical protein